MATQHLLVVIFLASILICAATSATTNSTLAADETVYDLLDRVNLPRGLLPQGVQSYELRGFQLVVTLSNACDFSVSVAGKQYKFRYARNVDGVLQPGNITQVHGVRVQPPVEFAWLDFNQAQRAGDLLNIQLEGSTLSFPVSSFAQSHICN